MNGAWSNQAFARTAAAAYDWALQHFPAADLYLRLITGESAAGLLRTMDVVTEAVDGSTVLDVPCGGGVTLRRVQPHQRITYIAAVISPTGYGGPQQHHW